MDCFLTRSIGRIDGTWEHNPFNGTRDDIIGKYNNIHHNCPHCGGVASESRSLIYLIKKCIKEGKCVYPCSSCGEPFIVPMSIWNSEGIETLRNSNLDRIPFSEIKIGELFVEKWEQVLIDTNSGATTQDISMTYDGKGSCPGCGCSNGTPKIQIKLDCPGCGQDDLWVDESMGNSNTDTKALCSRCGKNLTVPSNAWCSVCGIHFLPEKMVAKVFLEANRNIENVFQGSESSLPQKVTAIPQNMNDSVTKKWWRFWK